MWDILDPKTICTTCKPSTYWAGVRNIILIHIDYELNHRSFLTGRWIRSALFSGVLGFHFQDVPLHSAVKAGRAVSWEAEVSFYGNRRGSGSWRKQDQSEGVTGGCAGLPRRRSDTLSGSRTHSGRKKKKPKFLLPTGMGVCVCSCSRSQQPVGPLF